MSEEKKVITCSECGNKHNEPVKFCSLCGAKIEAGTTTTDTTETTAESSTSALEQSLLQEAPPAIDPVPVTEQVQTETIAPEPVVTASPDPQVTNPVYVEVPAQSTYTNQATYTTIDEGSAKPAGNGSPGFAIASMVLGILSLICCCFWPISLGCAIIAIILGIVAIYNKYDGKGMAIAGIVLGGISIVFAILWIVLLGSASVLEALNEYS